MTLKASFFGEIKLFVSQSMRQNVFFKLTEPYECHLVSVDFYGQRKVAKSKLVESLLFVLINLVFKFNYHISS